MTKRNSLVEDGEDALAGDWRGTNEEPQLALPGNDSGLALGRGCSTLDQYDCRRSGRDGRQGVHDNAQLAVIGVGLVRVEVCCLSDGQQGQKDEAQHSNDRQKVMPGAAACAEICLEFCQPMALAVLILQNNALIWTTKDPRG